MILFIIKIDIYSFVICNNFVVKEFHKILYCTIVISILNEVKLLIHQSTKTY